MGAHSIYTWDPNINNSIFRNCLRRKGFIFLIKVLILFLKIFLMIINLTGRIYLKNFYLQD